MKNRNYMLGTVAPVAILTLAASATWADTFDANPLIETSGDGYIYVDTSEGAQEPGIQAVTFVSTRVSDGSGGFIYVDPYENTVTDFSSLSSRGDVPNCLMASIPDVYCDSESGSGKRLKARLTGANPFDIRLRTTANDNFASVDYFTFGKVSNYSGARMTGFRIELLDADGNAMGDLTPEDAALFNLDATSIGLGSRLPDGLFGAGGNEGAIGFFSSSRAGLALTTSDDVLEFGDLSNADYVANFGTYFLDDTMVPEGIFWDENDDPDDESTLIAWNNLAGGGWTYGTLDIDANIDARLAELASSLGVDVADLGYVAGGLVPEDIVAAAEANGLFAIDPVEDLRNANLNYTITVGTIDGGEVTIRIAPTFAPIVYMATSEYQFRTAGYLDAAANVPYWDLGNSAAYQTAIADILALDEAAASTALNSIGFGYAPAFSSLSFESARNQISALTGQVPWGASDDTQVTLSSKGAADGWLMGDGLYGLVSLGGSRSSYDATSTSIGYDIDLTSASLGVEKHLSGSETSVGVALGYANGTASASQNLGDIDADGYSVTAFTRSRFGDGGLVQALIGYQGLSYDSSRSVMGETATGSTDGSQIFAALKVDYLKDMGGFKFGPTASLEYYNSTTEAFTEKGAGIWNLDVGEQSSDTVLASIGLRGEYSFKNGNSQNRLTGSIKYTKASGDDIDIQSGFIDLPTTSYTVAGMDENLMDVTLGFDSLLSSTATREVKLQGGYRGSFGENYESQGLHLGLNITF
ncbi:MAG: hypothetical protein ACJAYH_000162 [Celeribacter sp.]|jgi:uncharacterized protein YhjY with autotransporter beta-barrel domain